jgi:hypothetical protein
MTSLSLELRLAPFSHCNLRPTRQHCVSSIAAYCCWLHPAVQRASQLWMIQPNWILGMRPLWQQLFAPCRAPHPSALTSYVCVRGKPRCRASPQARFAHKHPSPSPLHRWAYMAQPHQRVFRPRRTAHPSRTEASPSSTASPRPPIPPPSGAASHPPKLLARRAGCPHVAPPERQHGLVTRPRPRAALRRPTHGRTTPPWLPRARAPALHARTPDGAEAAAATAAPLDPMRAHTHPRAHTPLASHLPHTPRGLAKALTPRTRRWTHACGQCSSLPALKLRPRRRLH